ncbi:MAG: APC family permease [Actinomycetia bacterium]|jgi:amino acid transporter|nr:APC family permease [Actinomycetes bacterium]
MTTTQQPPTAQNGGSNGDKGLKGGALGLMSSVVIAVASTAPGYSLAATLAFIVLAAGLKAPAILLLAFVPMYFTAKAYQDFNEIDPDCGTTFKWGWRAFGPHTGWLGGWGIIIADIIVMASLSQVAGSYFWLLLGKDDVAANTTGLAVTGVGVLFLVVVTWICYRGIELSARTQYVLLGIELAILFVFAFVALVKVYTDNALDTSVTPELSWLWPGGLTLSQIAEGLIIAIFIYWGWDTAVAVNEETADPSKTPGRAAILATIALVVTYVVIATAAQAFGGEEGVTNEEHQDDVLGYLGELVLGTWGGKLLILAVLTSAVASAQTTILPTARTTLSMAAFRAMPRSFARIHPQYLTPTVSTIVMGFVSIVFYVGMTQVSENLLADTIAATGLAIAFYYGLTGFAAAWYFRKPERRKNHWFSHLVLPALGGIMLFGAMIKVAVDSMDPDYGYTTFFGLGGVFVIGVGALALGLLLMVAWNAVAPEYFRSRPSDIEPRILVDHLVVEEHRIVLEAPGVAYNPEAMLASGREEPVTPEQIEALAAEADETEVPPWRADLGDESRSPEPTEPAHPVVGPYAEPEEPADGEQRPPIA